MARDSLEPSASSRLRLAMFLFLAATLHVLALKLLAKYVSEPGSSDVRPPVAWISPSAVANAVKADRALRPPAAQPRRPPPPPKPEKMSGQVVDLPPTADARAPEHADFLSEHNTRTEHESRSRHQSPDYKNVMNEPASTHKAEAKTPSPVPGALALEVEPSPPKEDHERNLKRSGAAVEIPRVQERERLALKLDPTLGRFNNKTGSAALEGNSDRLMIVPGETSESPAEKGSAPARGLTMADLVPQVGVLARLEGGPTNDALTQVDEGEGTFLNSREFRYASFFNRLKRGVSENWRPLVEYQRRDPTGNIYGIRARVTVVSVTLNDDGSLNDIQVKQSSGVDFLDSEAVAAFRRAEPFPNPPKGLADDTGKICFPFGFHIDFGMQRGLQAPY